MKRIVVVLAVVALLLVGALPAALAANESSQGEQSTGRNAAGFGGGPHCHELIVESAEGTRVYPSHRAHLSSGVGHVFAAVACPE